MSIYQPPSKDATHFLWSKDGMCCMPRAGTFFIDFAWVDELERQWAETVRICQEEASWEDIF